jgi:tRNA threonylcarbamoyladenosine biosynthesis protein TsaE
VEGTERVAAELARSLRGGEVIALEGELGAGKTAFARGLCAALGAEGQVTSPTFAIMNVYGTRRTASNEAIGGATAPRRAFRIVHLDLYRLTSAREVAALGLEEYLGAPDTITLIEWPGAVDGVEWKPTHVVRLTPRSATERDVDIFYEQRRTTAP